MRPTIVRTLAVIGVGAIVLAGVLYVASTVDGRPPTVVDIRLTQPVGDDESLALVTTSVEVVFSELVEAGSAEAAVSLEPQVATAASWSGSTLTITPDEPLALDTDYVVDVADGVEDLAGNRMDQAAASFAFATVGRPALVASEPADGSGDVALDAPISLTFTTLMDTMSVAEHLSISPGLGHELRWSGRLLEIVATEPLAARTDYRIRVAPEATDVAGVPLGEAVSVTFTTIASVLEAATLIPADGIDGIATTSPIAVLFSEAIDPGTVEDAALTIEPAVAGSLEVVPLSGDPLTDDGTGRALVFTPSTPLPANTTFSIELAPGIATVGGDSLGVSTTWSFTTGVAADEISNQVTFISDRAGVANVWAMNADGTGQRQLSVELEPVVDYAVAPDGDSLVVADGHRLVHQRANGSERRVLTAVDVLEFDPAFSPDGRRVAFARADAASGSGLGIWEWQVGSGDAQLIDLPVEPDASPTPAPSGGPDDRLRAPRHAPDGSAIAFVDTLGEVAILDLAAGTLTTARFAASEAPIWLADSSGVMLAGSEDAPTSGSVLDVPVLPMVPGPGDSMFRLLRGGGMSPSPFGTGSRVVAIAGDGTIAYVDATGALWLTDLPNTASGVPAIDGVDVRAAVFGPGGDELVVEVGTGDSSRLELFDPATGRRSRLVDDGSQPRWLP